MGYILVFIGFLLTLGAQMYVNSTYRKYSNVKTRRGLTGYDVSSIIIAKNRTKTQIMRTSGTLSDHYDPKRDIVNLSDEIMGKPSISAAAVAAHECGHMMQAYENYVFLKIRSALVPVANFGSNAGIWIVMFSIILGLSPIFTDIGIILFSAGVLFQFVTLPVEVNASKRGMTMLSEYSILSSDELKLAKKVLTAAALTYIAAAASSVLQLLRLILIRNRRR